MVIESKYDLQETINRLQSSIHQAEYKLFMPPEISTDKMYFGTVSEDGFRIFKRAGKSL